MKPEHRDLAEAKRQFDLAVGTARLILEALLPMTTLLMERIVEIGKALDEALWRGYRAAGAPCGLTLADRDHWLSELAETTKSETSA